MVKFKEKPVVVEAIQWTGRNRVEVAKFIRGDALEINDTTLFPGDAMFIETLEGMMRADKGDWIIQGIKGELYSCKLDTLKHKLGLGKAPKGLG